MNAELKKRLETFTISKRKFVCLDMSQIQTNAALTDVIDAAKDYIKEFKPQTAYVISNVFGMMFDTATKDIISDWLKFNDEHAACQAVVNMDGIKMIMFAPSIEAVKRQSHLRFFKSRQQAVEWLSEA